MKQKPLSFAALVMTLFVVGGILWGIRQYRVDVQIGPSVTTDSVSETPAQTEPGKYPQHIEAIPGNADEVWYNIPECGVRMRLNREFAEDTQYIFANERGSQRQGCDTLYFSSRKLSVIAPTCAFGSIGVISIFQSGEAKGHEALDSIKPLSDLDILFSGPQNQKYHCWDSVPEAELREVFPGKYNGTGAKSVFDGFKTIELIKV